MLCRLTHKQHICSGQIRTGEAAGCRAMLVMEKAQRRCSVCLSLGFVPHTQGPSDCTERKGPCLGLKAPSCLLGCLCTISLKNQLSPFQSSQEGSGSPWSTVYKVCAMKKFPGKQFWPRLLSVNLGFALLIWKQEKKCHIVFPLNFSYLAWHVPFASLDHLSCRPALEERLSDD